MNMKILQLHKNIYTFSYIKFAIDAYSSIADIAIQENTEYWNVQFGYCEYDETLTIREFENYLISLEGTGST